MQRRVASCLYVVAIAAVWSATSAEAQAVTLSNTIPYAVAPGAATDVAFTGDNFNDPTGVWSNLPGLKATLITVDKDGKPAKPNPKQVRFKLEVPADAVPGIYGVRVTTAHGASNVRLLMVDDLPTVSESANKSRDKAQLLKPPVAVDAMCESETYDYYKFHADAGQRISVEVVGRRLGWPVDPVVRLLDAAGHELAFADDDESIGVDGRFTYCFQQAGDYTLEVRDIRYAGNTNYRYRLRVGDFPLLSAPYPMGVQEGTVSVVQPVGAEVGPIDPLKLAVPRRNVGGQLPLSARYADGQGSGTAVLIVGNDGEQTEIEPNDKPEQAAPLAARGAINGRFDAPKDRDHYKFDAKKGDRLRFIGRTRGYGSPSDLLLRVLAADGKQIVEAEDAGLEEGAVDFTAPADGSYILALEDLNKRGGPQFGYRVEIEPYRPGFTLALDAEKIDVPHDGTGKSKVTVVRRDYTGPIEFKLQAPAEAPGLTVSGTVPEGKPDGILTIKAAPDLKPGTLLNVTIVGVGTAADKTQISARATSAVALKTLLGGLTNPPGALSENLAISIGEPFADFYKLSTAQPVVALPQLAGKGSLVVKVEKLNKFDDVVTLAVEGLPPGVTAAAAKIDKGKAEATIELTGPATSAPIEQPFRVVGTATMTDQTKKVVLEGLTLRIVPPLETKIETPTPLSPGEKRKLKIQIVRHIADKAPIALRFKSLPAGVTAPAETTIAADKNEAEIELTVDAKAPLGPSAAQLTATATFAGRQVTLDAAAIGLRIVPAPPKAAAAK